MDVGAGGVVMAVAVGDRAALWPSCLHPPAELQGASGEESVPRA